MSIDKEVKKIKIEVEIDDLFIINAALNEVCNGLDIFDFEIRVGFSHERVQDLMKYVQKLIDQLAR